MLAAIDAVRALAAEHLGLKISMNVALNLLLSLLLSKETFLPFANSLLSRDEDVKERLKEWNAALSRIKLYGTANVSPKKVENDAAVFSALGKLQGGR